MLNYKSLSKNSLILISIMLLLLIPMINSSQNAITAYAESSQLSITIDGTAEQEVTPDTATIYANIQSLDLNEKTAKEKSKEIYNKVKNELIQNGLDSKNITIISFSLNDNQIQNYRQKSLGYCSNLRFQFKTNTKNMSSFFEILSNNGINDICSIEYSYSQSTNIYNELLKKAMNNAEQKAMDMLSNDNLQIVEITEKDNYYCPTLYKSGLDVFDDTNNIGQIKITAKVQVKFSVLGN